MGETVGNDIALGAALQCVVADCRRRLQRGLYIAGLDERRLALAFEVFVLAAGPHTCEAVCLQLDLDLNVIGLRSAVCHLLRLLCLR